MIKKIWIILTIFLSIFFLFSCTQTKDTITLPNLNGMTEEQALAVLSQHKLIVSTQNVINNDIREGRFIAYGQNYEANDVVKAYTNIILYFSVHANVLPNLSGKTQNEILTELAKINVIVEIQTFRTNDLPAGIFLNYGNQLQAGDVLDNGDEVLVFISEAIPAVNRGIIISKYLEGESYNRAVELFNITDVIIDLSTYKLSLYIDGSDTISHQIQLTGTINPQETFIIAYSNSAASILAKADMLSNALTFNGNDTIALNDSNNQIVDIIGNIGWGLFYLSDRTLVRDPSITQATAIFNVDEWNQYRADYDVIFGTHPIEYPTPYTFDSAFLSISFTAPGGMIEVEYYSIYDGDTAYFTPGFLGEDRVRFIGIDTPEIGSGTLATEARNFAASLLSNATTIYLQHDPASGNVDTYERYLALIWADGVLVNYELVRNGYSQNNYQDSSNALIFNNIPLSIWMTNAEKYAKANHLGVWA
ncbi:MAG: lamin tail domain-containing protein [Bacillota bacterium]